MNDTATEPQKTRKPNVGSDPGKGALVSRWQVGFYAFAIGANLVLWGVCLFYIVTGNFPRFLIPTAVLVTGLSWGLLTAKLDSFDEPDGVKVTDAEAELLQFVHDVVRQVNAPTPDAVYLTTAAELGISEETRFFGRKVERSVLTIGLPYLYALTRAELAALLAYELALYADTGVIEGVRAMRGLEAARGLIATERQGFVNGVYGSYARKMFRSVGGVGVAHEEAADRVAVESYGSKALRSALSRYDETAVAFDQLLREYVVPALQHQAHPKDMFGGFEKLLKSSTRAAQRKRDVERRGNKNRNEFELHLTASERRARLENWPPSSGSAHLAAPDSAAHALLEPEAKSADIVVASWASKLMNNRTHPQTWQELTDDIYSAKAQSLASMVFDDETDAAAQFEQALAWSSADDWSSVDGTTQACLKSIDDPAERRTKWARCVVAEAAAATGSFHWQHSWDGPPTLVDRAGESLNALHIAGLMVEGNAAEARTVFEAAVRK